MIHYQKSPLLEGIIRKSGPIIIPYYLALAGWFWEIFCALWMVGTVPLQERTFHLAADRLVQDDGLQQRSFGHWAQLLHPWAGTAWIQPSATPSAICERTSEGTVAVLRLDCQAPQWSTTVGISSMLPSIAIVAANRWPSKTDIALSKANLAAQA